jgi:hypothetical protein
VRGQSRYSPVFGKMCNLLYVANCVLGAEAGPGEDDRAHATALHQSQGGERPSQTSPKSEKLATRARHIAQKQGPSRPEALAPGLGARARARAKPGPGPGPDGPGPGWPRPSGSGSGSSGSGRSGSPALTSYVDHPAASSIQIAGA